MPIASIDPSTGKTIGIFEELTDREIDEKLARAVETYREYRRTTFEERAEKMMRDKVNAHYKDRMMLMGRCANLTKAGELQLQQGRSQCQARDLCYRGCPFGAYFSSNSSTLPWAEKSGNLTLRPGSVVHSIIYDEQKGKATGVRVIDAKTKKATEYFARIIFVNAACLNSNLILLI